LFNDGRARAYLSTCLIKTSTIQGAGNGVFATRHFYPEDPITIHAFTRIITAAEHESLKGKREYDYVLFNVKRESATLFCRTNGSSYRLRSGFFCKYTTSRKGVPL
jgi:hypothetical protein